MPRAVRKLSPKKAIYVFWEGESEEAYMKYIRREFTSKAVLALHREKGLFATAGAFYRGNQRFRSDLPELDEIWFFFDTEIEKGSSWDDNMRFLEGILRARKQNPIKIRLLMTTCCVEYWFLLHYKKQAPSLALPAGKEKMLKELQKFVPAYQKGNDAATATIAENYPTAIENGRWTLERLKDDGMPEEDKERDPWLYKGTHTFTTVHEAIEMLVQLPKL